MGEREIVAKLKYTHRGFGVALKIKMGSHLM